MLRYKNTYYDGPLAPYLCFSDMLKDQLISNISNMLKKYNFRLFDDPFVHYNEVKHSIYVVIEVDVSRDTIPCLDLRKAYEECEREYERDVEDEDVEVKVAMCVAKKEEEYRRKFKRPFEFKYEKETEVGKVRAWLETRETGDDDPYKLCLRDILVVEFEFNMENVDVLDTKAVREVAERIAYELDRVLQAMKSLA